jgi:hypothetical protein
VHIDPQTACGSQNSLRVQLHNKTAGNRQKSSKIIKIEIYIVGQGEAMPWKYKRLKLSGGQVFK